MRVFDPRTKAVTYDVPNVKALGFDWPDLKAATEDFDRLKEDLDKTVAKVRQLTEARRDAEGKDQRALAAAIREGKDDPGEKHVEKVGAEMRQAERRRDALRIAIQEQAAAITTVIDEHRCKWRSEVSDRLPQAQDRLEAAEREAEAARGELRGLQGLASWLQEPAKPYAPQEAAKNTNTIIRGGINRHEASEARSA